MDLPAHPLLVHAAVVFVPLQALSALSYTLVPALRRHITWAVVALAVVAPLCALLAVLSGDALRDRLVRNGIAGEQLIASVDAHRSLGTMVLYSSAALGLATLVLWLVARSRSRASSPGKGSLVAIVVLGLVVLAASAVSGYYVFRTGDSGASMVWSGM